MSKLTEVLRGFGEGMLNSFLFFLVEAQKIEIELWDTDSDGKPYCRDVLATIHPVTVRDAIQLGNAPAIVIRIDGRETRLPLRTPSKE